MKVLLIGAGGVGEAIAVIAQDQPWLEQMVMADYSLERLNEVHARLNSDGRFAAEEIDARDRAQIIRLAKKYEVDLILNAVDPIFNESIFDAAFEAGCNYMDMAMTLSRAHPERPYEECDVKLGDYQFERSRQWEEKGLLALVGMGVEPGMADVFARYAEKHLFDEIEEIGIRDGSGLVIREYAFAPTFSIWTTIEECLNPPVIWEEGRGWFTTETFSEPEIFDFPEGIGPIKCVNVEHEEVLLIPRRVECKRVTFKYGLGDEFIEILKMLHKLGLDKTEPVNVKGISISPRDVVAACLPNPAYLGDKMSGKTCAGTWVKGTRDGQPYEVFLYQVADNEITMQRYGVQAAAWQTAVSPVIAMELLQTGQWKGAGVLGPEAFDPDPFMELMPAYDFEYGCQEMPNRSLVD